MEEKGRGRGEMSRIKKGSIITIIDEAIKRLILIMLL